MRLTSTMHVTGAEPAPNRRAEKADTCLLRNTNGMNGSVFVDRLIDTVAQRDFTDAMQGYLVTRSAPARNGPPVDFLFAAGKDPKLPDEVFHQLLWGGLFIYADRDEKRVRGIAREYDGKRGFPSGNAARIDTHKPPGLPLPRPVDKYPLLRRP